MKANKGQAGLDFLMTYGWALLVIVLIIAALFALGIFDIGSFLGSKATGFSQIGVVGWTLGSNGAFSVMLENHAGKSITLTAVNATYRGQTLSYAANTTIANGKRTGTLALGSYPVVDPAGTTSTIAVTMTYIDPDTGFVYSDAGTLTGKVQQ
jgi:hypothetical protein